MQSPHQSSRLTRLTLLVLVAGLGAASPARLVLADTFTGVVEKHFAQWDANADGRLTPEEVDKLSVDPQWKGEHAAAIAALKSAMRSKKTPLGPVARAELAEVAKKPLAPDPDAPFIPDAEKPAKKDDNAKPAPDGAGPSPADAKDPAAPDRKPAAAKRVDTLEARFARANRVIKNTKRGLFLDPTPDLDKFHQGRIGDCFFVSMVGAMVERDPKSVVGMIQAEKAEKDDAVAASYTVKFGDGRTATVIGLTDSELALVSTTGDEGLWLPVLEKAYGSLRMETRPEDHRALSQTDSIASGGSTATSIRALTGHKTEGLRLPGSGKSTPGASKPSAPADPAPTSKPGESESKEPKPEAAAPADFSKLLAKLREKLALGTREHRLMGAGTGPDREVPGINPNHAYAIFGFDQTTDTVHMWNPHGNAFKPKGPAGIAHGYPTKVGRFDIPLAEFIHVFRGFVMETDQPVEKKDGGKGAGR